MYTVEIIITEPLLKGLVPAHSQPFAAEEPDDYVVCDAPLLPKDGDLPYAILTWRNARRDLVRLLRQKGWDSLGWFRLAVEAEELAAEPPNGDSLLTPVHLAETWQQRGVIPYPHQLETARQVLVKLSGRAILADEVGLGKTIEAGLVAKEYLLKGLVRRLLVLVPAALCRQWQAELREKFNIPAWVARSEWDWDHCDLLVASLDFAKNPRHRAAVVAQPWDLVIVDEAHKLKNAQSQNFRFLTELRSKYLLMLTATPVQNDLKELYNLITLLRPGQLGTYPEFRHRYAAGRREAKNTDQLRALLAEVMIRHHRDEQGIHFTKRTVHPLVLEFSPAEATFYSALATQRRTAPAGSAALFWVTVLREACSSAYAAALTLEGRARKIAGQNAEPGFHELAEQGFAVASSAKVEALEQLLTELGAKALVFTEYRASAALICNRLAALGLRVVPFDGSMSASRKEFARYVFAHAADVMVSTESGGEGLNLQFCHVLVNYDLPWNPMRVEQRIGRLHRLGQTEDVDVFNLVTRGTIEERLMTLLYEKVELFTSVIGTTADLFGPPKLLGPGFERKLLSALAGATDEDDEATRLAALATELEKAGAATSGPCRDWWDVL